ncbi:hypothetical protein [uncultured Mediterranean phage uvDeep-CGR2-KM21-C338]|nr:hypothetical protein [uncultured Mediterranean phage uvDeep-CGR2-KM21-C338]
MDSQFRETAPGNERVWTSLTLESEMVPLSDPRTAEWEYFHAARTIAVTILGVGASGLDWGSIHEEATPDRIHDAAVSAYDALYLGRGDILPVFPRHPMDKIALLVHELWLNYGQ